MVELTKSTKTEQALLGRAKLETDESDTESGEQFDRETKFAFILAIEKMDEKYTTYKGVPEVVDDFRKAKQTAKIMGILPENTIALKDVSHEELQRQWDQLEDKIYPLARVLGEHTGILGASPRLLSRGLLWDKIKNFAMKLQAPFDSITIDLDVADQ